MRRFFRPLFTSPPPKMLVEQRRTAGDNTESSVAVANKKRAAGLKYVQDRVWRHEAMIRVLAVQNGAR